MAWNSRGTHLATTHYTPSKRGIYDKDARSVWVWDTTTTRKMCELQHAELEEVKGIAWNADGKRLVTNVRARNSEGGAAFYLWDAVSGKQLHRIEINDFYSAAITDPLTGKASTQRFASKYGDQVLNWSPDGNFVRAIYFPEISDAAPTIDDNSPVFVARPGKIQEWNVVSGAETEIDPRDVPSPDGSSPNGKMLAISLPLRQTLEIRCPILFDKELKGYNRKELEGYGRKPNCVTCNGRLIAYSPSKSPGSTRQDDTSLWNAETLQNVTTIEKIKSPLLSPDGQWLAALIPHSEKRGVNGDYQVHTLNIFSIAPSNVVKLESNDKLVTGIRQWCPDSRTLVFAGEDQRLRLWDATKRKESTFTFGSIWDFSRDGKLAAQALDGFGKVIIADPATGSAAVHAGAAGGQAVRCLAWSRSGRAIATIEEGAIATMEFGNKPWQLKTWNVDSPGKEALTMSLPQGPAQGSIFLFWGPDDQHLIFIKPRNDVSTFGSGSEFVICDVNSGAVIRTWLTEQTVRTAVSQTNGNRLASADDSHVTLWEPISGREILKLPLPKGTASGRLAWSRDGQILFDVNNPLVRWDAGLGFSLR